VNVLWPVEPEKEGSAKPTVGGEKRRRRGKGRLKTKGKRGGLWTGQQSPTYFQRVWVNLGVASLTRREGKRSGRGLPSVEKMRKSTKPNR